MSDERIYRFPNPFIQYVRSIQIPVGDIIYMVKTIRQVLRSKEPNEARFMGYVQEGEFHQFTRIPYEDEGFSWIARHFVLQDVALLVEVAESKAQPIIIESLCPIDIAKMAGPVWCPVANMTEQRSYGPGGQEIRRGSKHFAPGAKLYCYPPLWGDGYKQIQVVGRHRGSHGYVKMIVRSDWLTNWRVRLVYSPHVIRQLWPFWDGTERSQVRAKELVNSMFWHTGGNGEYYPEHQDENDSAPEE